MTCEPGRNFSIIAVAAYTKESPRITITIKEKFYYTLLLLVGKVFVHKPLNLT